MGSATPHGVVGDTRGDGVSSSPRQVVDRSFFGRQRSLTHPFSAITTPVQVYVSDGGAFHIMFGSTGASFELWTDSRGLDEVIAALQAAKVRAQIAGIPQYRPAPLDPMDEVPW